MKLRNLLLSPKGKIKRLDYLKGVALAFTFILIFIFSPTIIKRSFSEIVFSSKPWVIGFFICYVLGVFGAIYTYCICLNGKRLRDMGYSAWWSILGILIFFIPFLNMLNWILFIYPSEQKQMQSTS